jgi:hypothetical protein
MKRPQARRLLCQGREEIGFFGKLDQIFPKRAGLVVVMSALRSAGHVGMPR